ncbi:MAG: diguanylate cyclase [Thermoanaerobaculia bacterium]
MPLLVFSIARTAALPAESVTPVRSFRAFDKKSSNGLPQSTPLDLWQDDSGLLWIATLDGVATFDGNQIERIPSTPAAPGRGAVYCFERRRGGGLYVGGSRGVHVNDGRGWRLLPTASAVLSVAADRSGALWIVDEEGKVWRNSNPDAPAQWDFQGDPRIPTPAVTVSSDDSSIWIGGKSGVARVTDGAIEPSESSPKGVSAILSMPSGECWAGTEAGTLFVRKSGSTEWSPVPLDGWDGGRIRCLASDRRGRVWAGGNEGRVAFGRETGPWEQWGPENGLKPATVNAILADREGSVWFGFNGSGLQQLLSEAWTHRIRWATEGSLSPRTPVFGIAPDSGGGFLAAAVNRGLWHWDGRQMHTLDKGDGLTEDVVCAAEPSPGVIWAGSRTGIFESRSGGRFRKVFDLPTGFVTSFAKSPAGEWFATTSSAGILRLEDGAWTPTAELNRQLPAQNARVMTWFRNGDVGVGTMHGLAIFHGGARLTAAEGLGVVPEAVSSLLQLGGGEIWAGGTNGIAIRKDGLWRRGTRVQGFPSDTVYSLALAPDGSVWEGSGAGVGRYFGGRWTYTDDSNGLIEDECNSGGLWIAPDRTAYVGTMASLARFDPTISPLEPPPLVCLWRDVPAADADGIARLPDGTRRVRVTWRAPWLTPRPVEYRVRVARLVRDWLPVQSKSEFVLENLPEGRFDIEAQARLAGPPAAPWTSPIRLSLFVEPFWWETNPAKGAGAALLALMIFGLVRLRTRQLAGRAARLDEEVARQTAELRESHLELQKAHRALEELARRDALTGLYNRRMADERLHEAFAARRRTRASISVMLVDVDNLKAINDLGGHDVGDVVLKAVAGACRSVFRASDLIVRYGGDEFLIFLPETGEEEASVCADRLIAELAELPPVQLKTDFTRLQISGGVATAEPSREESPAGLIERADRALYAAKGAGRNRIVVFSSIGDSDAAAPG